MFDLAFFALAVDQAQPAGARSAAAVLPAEFAAVGALRRCNGAAAADSTGCGVASAAGTAAAGHKGDAVQAAGALPW